MIPGISTKRFLIMTKEDARLLFMDYMYGELDPNQEQKLLSYISQHDDLQQELEELTEAKSLLQHLPVESPKEQLVIMEPETNTTTHWWKGLLSSLIPTSTFARTSFGLVASVFLFVILAASTDLNVSLNDNGFNLAFGEPQTVQQGFSPEQVQLIVDQVQRQNAQMVNQIVTDAQVQQNLLLDETLEGFANYLEDQRNYDLQQITRGITSLEQNTFNRFRQTDQVLGELIQTVSYEN